MVDFGWLGFRGQAQMQSEDLLPLEVKNPLQGSRCLHLPKNSSAGCQSSKPRHLSKHTTKIIPTNQLIRTHQSSSTINTNPQRYQPTINTNPQVDDTNPGIIIPIISIHGTCVNCQCQPMVGSHRWEATPAVWRPKTDPIITQQ